MGRKETAKNRSASGVRDVWEPLKGLPQGQLGFRHFDGYSSKLAKPPEIIISREPAQDSKPGAVTFELYRYGDSDSFDSAKKLNSALQREELPALRHTRRITNQVKVVR